MGQSYQQQMHWANGRHLGLCLTDRTPAGRCAATTDQCQPGSGSNEALPGASWVPMAHLLTPPGINSGVIENTCLL